MKLEDICLLKLLWMKEADTELSLLYVGLNDTQKDSEKDPGQYKR